MYTQLLLWTLKYPDEKSCLVLANGGLLQKAKEENIKRLLLHQVEVHLGSLLGGSGWVVNSLDFCLALLKSLGCFYFQCILSSQWKAVTVNLHILHCQL